MSYNLYFFFHRYLRLRLNFSLFFHAKVNPELLHLLTVIPSCDLIIKHSHTPKGLCQSRGRSQYKLNIEIKQLIKTCYSLIVLMRDFIALPPVVVFSLLKMYLKVSYLYPDNPLFVIRIIQWKVFEWRVSWIMCIDLLDLSHRALFSGPLSLSSRVNHRPSPRTLCPMMDVSKTAPYNPRVNVLLKN